MKIRNWRDVKPTIAHGAGIDYRLLSMQTKTSGDIPAEVEPEFRCLKEITYVSMARLEPGKAYEAHSHSDHEEVYYIISGRGRMTIDKEDARFKDGDVIYIPVNMMHSIANDGDETVEFLAFGGLTDH